jgi:hypothetical protein
MRQEGVLRQETEFLKSKLHQLECRENARLAGESEAGQQMALMMEQYEAQINVFQQTVVDKNE